MSLSLLWRATRDGFKAKDFHRLCNDKPNTLLIIKSTTGYIFGGYASLAWSSSGGSKSDSNAFLFTFCNPANMPLKLNIKKEEEEWAVYHDSEWGPTFGSDLFVSGEPNTNNKSRYSPKHYDEPNGQKNVNGGIFVLGGSTANFQTAEIEVFQVRLKTFYFFVI